MAQTDFTSRVEKSNIIARFSHHVAITVSPKTLLSEMKIPYQHLATANSAVLQIMYRTVGHLVNPKVADLLRFGDKGRIGGELY